MRERKTTTRLSCWRHVQRTLKKGNTGNDYIITHRVEKSVTEGEKSNRSNYSLQRQRREGKCQYVKTLQQGIFFSLVNFHPQPSTSICGISSRLSILLTSHSPSIFTEGETKLITSYFIHIFFFSLSPSPSVAKQFQGKGCV